MNSLDGPDEPVEGRRKYAVAPHPSNRYNHAPGSGQTKAPALVPVSTWMNAVIYIVLSLSIFAVVTMLEFSCNVFSIPAAGCPGKLCPSMFVP